MKKLLSLLLIFAMALSLLPVTALAAEDPVPTDAEETTVCQVTGISIGGTTATVEYQTDRAAELVVAIYDEKSTQMLGSGHRIVSPGATTAAVEITIGSMPAYYIASAYLLDADTLEPLCDAYVTSLYILEKLNVWASGSCGENAVWTIYENGLLVISGAGAMDDYDYLQKPDSKPRAPWAGYNVKEVVVEDGVTSIGSNAFHTQQQLADVTISASVTSIGDYAFSDCMTLKTVTIGNGVTSVGNKAFRNCPSLESVTIPDSVTALGDRVFANCTALESVTIGNSVTDIGEYTFAGCTTLKNAIIPRNVKSIGNDAFQSCTALERVVIENGVTSVGSSAFYGCSALRSVTIPDSVTSIGAWALANCTALESITIPGSVTSIGYGILSGCTLLRDVYYGGSDTQWAIVTARHGNATLPDEIKLHCGKATGKMVCSGNCGENLIWELDDTGTLYIRGAGSMMDYDWHYSSQSPWSDYRTLLKNVVIEDGVTRIGAGTFYACTALESITIPESVTSISSAFADSDTLKDVYYGGTAAQWVLLTGYYAVPEEATIHYGTGSGKTLYSGSCGEDLTWALLDTGELRISGTGEIEDFPYPYSSYIPWYNYRAAIESVVIKEGVTNIGDKAFYDCTAIESVSLPESMTSIGIYPFSSCAVLKDVYYSGTRAQWTFVTEDYHIPSKATMHYGKGSGKTLYSGTCDDGLTWALLDTGALHIRGTGAMANYSYSSEAPWYSYRKAIESVVIEDGVTSIGNFAFSDCTTLKAMTLGKDVTSVEDFAFSFCPAFTTYEVSADNTTYSVVDGVLFNKSKTALVSYPQGKEEPSYTIPDGVTHIEKGAFSWSATLENITIPDSVTSIGDQSLGLALKDVYYGGTKQQWTLISIGPNNSSLTNATIHYVEATGKAIYSGTCGENLTWELLDTGELRISGTGAMDGYQNYAPWYSYRSIITNIVLDAGVTSIGYDSFCECTSLTSVTIPNSVTSIGGCAFEHCTSLESITIPDSVTEIGWYAFHSCTSLKSIAIPDSVTSIKHGVFYYCTALESVTLPDGITNIESQMFSNCTSLKSIVLPASVTSIESYAFDDCTALENITIPERVSSIGYQAFCDCTSLTDVYYGSTKTWWDMISIAENNDSLADATIHYSEVSDILLRAGTCGTGVTWELYDTGKLVIAGTGAVRNYETEYSETDYTYYSTAPWYSYRSLITSVKIEDGVTSIGNYAFYYCESLESITIPDSVTSIAERTFYNCTSLTDIYYAGSLTEWMAVSGYSNIMSAKIHYLGAADELVDFGTCGNDLTWSLYDTGKLVITGSGAMTAYSSSSSSPWYSYRKTIESIEIEDGVTSIGDYAFEGCSALKSTTLPASMTSIGDDAFYNCTALESASYPGSKVRWAFVKVGQNNTALTRILNYSEASNTVLHSGICGSNLTWEFYDTGELVISGTGQMIDYTSASPAPWNEFKSVVQSVTIANGVTTIGERSFSNCTSLKSVTIGDNVTSVGGYAFNDCALINVTLPDGVISIGQHAFNCCTELNSVAIPDSVTAIGEGAFQSCRSLKSFVIPDGVTNIESYTFYNCQSLTSITIGSGVVRIRNSAFLSCSTLADVYITDLAAWCKIAFGSYYGHPMDWANNLYINGELATEIVIPDSVTSIAYRTFYNCTALESVTIPASVVSIGYEAFYGCKSLGNITIPYTVQTVGESAFDGCNSLSTVHYNSTETWWASMQIGNYNTNLTCATICFSGTEDDVLYSGTCGTNLKWELVASRRLVISGTGAMTNYSTSDRVPWKSYSNYIDSVVIEDSVTSIGSYAFRNCTALESVTIPDSVTSIENYAFYSCTALASITIPNSVTSIGGSAFYGCTALVSITVPNSVTSIGGSAFYGCTALVSASYSGSAVQWKLVDVGSSNNALIDVLQCAEAASKIIRSGTCGDSLIWELYDTGELRISGTGTMTEYGSYPSSARAPWYFYRDAILSVVIENGVASIGACAFWCCTMVENVVISDSVKSIGGFSFYGCAALKSITFPTGMTGIVYDMFRECTSLTSIVIPAGVTDIGSYAFYDCTALESITIPESVTSIWDSAFYNCKALKDVYYTGTQAQWNAVTISENNDSLTSSTIHCTGEEAVIDTTALDGAAEQSAEEPAAEKTFEEITEEVTEEVATEETTEEATEENTKETTEESTEESTAETTDETTEVANEEGTEEATEEPSAETAEEKFVYEADEIELVAAYTGALSEANGQKVASFSDLTPNKRYVLLVMKDAAADDILAAENLLYIMQGMSTTTGALSLTYVPRESTANAVAVVYGSNKSSLSSTTIAVGVAVGDNVVVTVTADGVTLVAGADYTFTATEVDGVISATVTGCGEYIGTTTVTLDHVPGDMDGKDGVTILDVLALLKAVAGIASEPAHADVNGDGHVTILDVLTLLKYVAGINGTTIY